MEVVQSGDGIAGGKKAVEAYELAGIVMKDGWFINESGERVIQKMQHPRIGEIKGIQKGVETILKERGYKHISRTTGKKVPLLCSLCKSEDRMAYRSCHSCRIQDEILPKVSLRV